MCVQAVPDGAESFFAIKSLNEGPPTVFHATECSDLPHCSADTSCSVIEQGHAGGSPAGGGPSYLGSMLFNRC